MAGGGFRGQSAEDLYVSIEADISALLRDAEKGVEGVQRELKQMERPITQAEARFEIMKQTIQRVAQATGQSFKQAGEEIRQALSMEGIEVDQAEINRAVKSLDEGLEEAGEEAEKTEGRMKRVGDAAKKVIAGLAAVAGVIAAAFKEAQEAIRGMRLELSFRLLAASAEQSSEEILTAMREASLGTIADAELMRQANVAMQLSVARTPEEFEKLTMAATTLGRAMGLDAAQGLELLINAAGRRSTEVLDNLGISLAEVNTKMETFAQQQFGKTVNQLSQAQRNALFMQATLDVAAEKAEQLGGATEDLGTAGERAQAQFKNLRQELGEFLAMIFDVLGMIGSALTGGEGVINRMIRGAKAWQKVFIGVIAIVKGAGAAISELIDQVVALEFNLDDIEMAFKETFTETSEMLEERFQQVIDPEEFAAGIAAGIEPLQEIPEATDEALAETLAIVDRFSTQMIDEAENMAAERVQIARDLQDELIEIEQEGVEKRAQIDAQLEERNAAAITKAGEALAKLESDTDEKRETMKAEAEIKRRRRRQDHLREMRRLEQRFLDDVADAVKNRDARALVDLMRKHRREKSEREEDFQTKEDTEKEDLEIRQRELERAEDKRRREIEKSLAKQLATNRREHQKQLAEQMQAERKAEADARASAARRQADLNAALQRRLASIARELADEERIDREGAARILAALNETFGVGGDIDALMEDFASRRRQRMIVRVTFEPEEVEPYTPTQQSVPRVPGEPIEYQTGGVMVARRPTLAMFGEVPELAACMPLSRLGAGGPTQASAQRLQIDLNLSGTAPPGIGARERDAIAGVLLQAIRDSGWVKSR
jgi:hypothetical protein